MSPNTSSDRLLSAPLRITPPPPEVVPAETVPLASALTAPTQALDNQALASAITTLAANIHAASYRLLTLVAAFDSRGGWADDGALSCAHWLNWACGISLHAAREKVRVAHALAELPSLGRAFARGEVSYSKVRAITRIGTADNEDYLLMIARYGTAQHVERLVSAYRRALGAAERDRAARQRAQRRLHWRVDDDGMLEITCRLPPEQGAAVVKAIEAAVDDLRAHEQETEESKEPSDRPEDVPEGTPAGPEACAQRRADALTLLADSYIEHGPPSRQGNPRYQVTVHVDQEVLSHPERPGRCELDHGPALAAETARRIACDTAVCQVHEGRTADGQIEPLSVGRRTRSIPPAIRRALEARDQGCRFPGCTATRFVHAHHIEHWAAGGETALSNLVTLCSHHHHLVHEGGYRVDVISNHTACRGRPTGLQLEFRRPDGSRLSGATPPNLPGAREPVEQINRRAGLPVRAEACRPRGDSEFMDYSLGVESLLHLDPDVHAPGHPAVS